MDCLEQCMTIAISHVAYSGKQYYSELSLPMGTTIYEALTLVPWVHGEEFEDFGIGYKNNLDNSPNHKSWYVGILAKNASIPYFWQAIA